MQLQEARIGAIWGCATLEEATAIASKQLCLINLSNGRQQVYSIARGMVIGGNEILTLLQNSSQPLPEDL